MQRQIKSIKQYAKVGKLDSSSHVEANAGEINIPTFSIALAGSPNSCIIKIEHKKYRSLVDSGAEVSLMHRRVYQSIKNAPKLTKKKAFSFAPELVGYSAPRDLHRRAAYSICESWFLIHQDVYHDLFVCS